MKKLLTMVAALFLAFMVNAQSFTVDVCGQVTNTNGQSVTVMVFDAMNGNPQTVTTNANGEYCAQLVMSCDSSVSYGVIAELANGCGVWGEDADSVNVTNPNCANVSATINLSYCDSTSNSCQTSFQFTSANNDNMISFFGNSSTGAVSYAWDFGDGTTDLTQNPVHTFPQDGNYTVCLSTTDASGCTSDYCMVVTVSTNNGGNNGICEAIFTSISDSCGFVSFQNGSSQGEAYWDFGDGNYSNDWSPSNNYDDAGDYIVSLTIFTADSCIEFYQAIVSVTDDGCFPSQTDCYADFYLEYTDWYNNAGEVMCVNWIGDANAMYTWDMGDGTVLSGFEPTHTYATSGLYTICMTMDDGNGCVSTICYTCWIDGADSAFEYGNDVIDSTGLDSTSSACEAYFVAIIDSTYDDSMLYIVDLSYGNNLSYDWNFGNGTSSGLNDPSYTYGQAGSYDICLTIDDNAGCTSTYCETVTYDGSGITFGKNAIGDDGFSIQVIGAPRLSLTAGVMTELENGTFEAYPNPVSDNLNIEFNAKGTSDVVLRNVTGQIVDQQQIQGNGIVKTNVSMSDMPNGIYFLSVTIGGSSQVVKVVKSH